MEPFRKMPVIFKDIEEEAAAGVAMLAADAVQKNTRSS